MKTYTLTPRRGCVTVNGFDYCHPDWFSLHEITITETAEGMVDSHGRVPERIKPVPYLPEARLEEALARREIQKAHRALQSFPETHPHSCEQIAESPESGGDGTCRLKELSPHEALREER